MAGSHRAIPTVTYGTLRPVGSNTTPLPTYKSEAGTYLPAYIPIGEDGAGDYLVVDTRSGDRQGCVVDFFGEGVETLQWASIEVMLDSTATALEQGADCEGWVPVVENGLLRWDFQP